MNIFLSFSSYFSNSWSDYFLETDKKPDLYGYTQINQFNLAKEGNLYIYNVIFTTVTELGNDGGAIKINMPASNFLVENSNFVHCASVGTCGAISCDVSECALKMVCSIDSHSNLNQYHFSNLRVGEHFNKTITTDFLSLSGLNRESEGEGNNFVTTHGTIKLKHINISRNTCSNKPCMYHSPTKQDGISERISYCSFENNTSHGLGVIRLSMQTVYFMIKCNVIGNKANKEGDGIIYFSKTLHLVDSCLLENSANPTMFSSFVEGATILIENCNIDNKVITGGKASIIKDQPHPKGNKYRFDLNNNACFTVFNKCSKNIPNYKKLEAFGKRGNLIILF